MDGLLLSHQVSLRKRDNVHCRNKLNSLKRYTYLKNHKVQAFHTGKGKMNSFCFSGDVDISIPHKKPGHVSEKNCIFQIYLAAASLYEKNQTYFSLAAAQIIARASVQERNMIQLFFVYVVYSNYFILLFFLQLLQFL